MNQVHGTLLRIFIAVSMTVLTKRCLIVLSRAAHYQCFVLCATKYPCAISGERIFLLASKYLAKYRPVPMWKVRIMGASILKTNI